MKNIFGTTVDRIWQCIAKYRQGIFSKARLALVGVPFIILMMVPHVALGFTQSGAGTFLGSSIPMGHEWITRLAAFEVIGRDLDPLKRKLSYNNDPRKDWKKKGLAKNIKLKGNKIKKYLKVLQDETTKETRYKSQYKFIYDAILGERWVDIAGFNITKETTKSMSGGIDCWDAVVQQAAEVQYDHFMRRYDDRDGQGGVDAATRSQERFVEYFVAAATAPKQTISVWDGGVTSKLEENVDYNYFLFGRAVHLFQDSFSKEHTVRIAEDNFEKVRQVKSYLCAAGSEQHSHSNADVGYYSSGDVIWKRGTRLALPGWPSYKPSNMTTLALVSLEATKDLWAAFIRTMSKKNRKNKATREAKRLVRNWLSFKKNKMKKWYKDVSNRGGTYVFAQGETSNGVTSDGHTTVSQYEGSKCWHEQPDRSSK